MKTAHDYMLEAFGPEWSGKVWDMDRLKAKVERAITEAVIAEREACAQIADERVNYYHLQYISYLDIRDVDKYVEALGILEEIRARTPAKGDGK